MRAGEWICCAQWRYDISKAELVAAVSEAGGLGVLSSSTFFTAEDLRAEIKKVKSLTDKPFAVNITFLPASFEPDFDGYIRVCKEEGVKIIETAGRIPSPSLHLHPRRSPPSYRTGDSVCQRTCAVGRG